MASLPTITTEDLLSLAAYINTVESIDKSQECIIKLMLFSTEYITTQKKKEELEALLKTENELQKQLKDIQDKKDKLIDKPITISKTFNYAQSLSNKSSGEINILYDPFDILKVGKQPEDIYTNFDKHITNDKELECLYTSIKLLTCAVWLLDKNNKPTEKVATFLQKCLSIVTTTCNIKGPNKNFSKTVGCHNPFCDDTHYNGITNYCIECTHYIKHKCTKKDCNFRHTPVEGKHAIQYVEWYFNSEDFKDTPETMKYVSKLIGFKGIIPKI